MSQQWGAGKYKQSFDNCTNFSHVSFYDVIYPISLLSLCCQYTCNVGENKLNSSKISPANLN